VFLRSRSTPLNNLKFFSGAGTTLHGEIKTELFFNSKKGTLFALKYVDSFVWLHEIIPSVS
jgi:hypothetical protein